MTLSEVRDQCDAAAKAIAQLPHEQWHHWTVYFLEAVDAQAQERQEKEGEAFGTAESILSRTVMALRTRLGIGTW